MLRSLKLAWFIHLPSTPTTATSYCLTYIQPYTCSVATVHSHMGNDTYKMKLRNIHSHTVTRRPAWQCYFCETIKKKKVFLMQTTERIFNFIILFKYAFFSISILHFLNKIEYLRDLLYCHRATSGSCWISNSRHNLILNYRLALAKSN